MRDAAYWRGKFHAMRREVRRANKAIEMFAKVQQLQAYHNVQLRNQLDELRKKCR